MPNDPDPADSAKPRRRWFQFRLRTLLVGVALLGPIGGYVAREGLVVAQRYNLLSRHTAGGADFLDGKAPKLQLVRRLLGDRPMREIIVSTPEDQKAAADLFPEAEVFLDGGGDGRLLQ